MTELGFQIANWLKDSAVEGITRLREDPKWLAKRIGKLQAKAKKNHNRGWHRLARGQEKRAEARLADLKLSAVAAGKNSAAERLYQKAKG